MGFSFRKSAKIGPFRINLSKSGIGVSAGVRGARISTGPRGTYVHLGANGIYYRKKINNPSVSSSPQHSRHQHQTVDNPGSAQHESRKEQNHDSFVESSGSDLINELNSLIQKPSYADKVRNFALFLFFSGIFLSYIIFNSFPNDNSSQLFEALILIPVIAAFAILLVGALETRRLRREEANEKTLEINYQLDDSQARQFSEFQESIRALSRSNRIWRITSEFQNQDWKRNAGVSNTVNRRPIILGLQAPPYIKTDIDVFGIVIDDMKLFFLPDQILGYKNKKYHQFLYDGIGISYTDVRFVEDGRVPSDVQVVGYNWRYSRVDGGPDRRFANNYQIPAVLYGIIRFSFAGQSGLVLHFSNRRVAEDFVERFNSYARTFHRRSQQDSRTESRYRRREKSEAESSSKMTPELARKILQVSSNASAKEVDSAYRKLLQMYHPDKVAGLAPEYQKNSGRPDKKNNCCLSNIDQNKKRITGTEKMLEDSEYTGYWWFPESKKRIAGTLSLPPGSAPTLQLEGNLEKISPLERMLSADKFSNPTVILGLSKGKYITLVDCFEKGGSVSFPGYARSSYAVRKAFVGTHFQRKEDIQFCSTGVNYAGLNDWFDSKGFRYSGPSDRISVVQFESPEPIIAKLGEFEVKLTKGADISGKPGQVTLKESTYLTLSSDNDRPLEDFKQILHSIQIFLSLAMGGPAIPLTVKGIREDIGENNKQRKWPIDIYDSSVTRFTDSPTPDFMNFLFKLSDIQENLGNYLNNWMTQADLFRPVYDYYFYAISLTNVYPETVFLHFTQAIEAYHRRKSLGKYQSDKAFKRRLYKSLIEALPADLDEGFKESLIKGKLRYANEYSLRKRLHEILEGWPADLGLSFVENTKEKNYFIDKVADTRNYFTHLTSELDKRAAKGKNLYDLIWKLRAMLEVCLLLEVGFDFTTIRGLISDKWRNNR